MVSVNRTLQAEEDVEASQNQSQATFHQAFLCSLSLAHTQQLRYTSAYGFLCQYFSIFNKQCSLSYLAPKLEDLIENGIAKLDVTTTLPLTHMERFSEFQAEKTLPSEFKKPDAMVFPEQKLPYPNVNEMCFQWYSPSFNNIVTALYQDQTPIYLLCTATKKKDKPGEILCFVDYFLFPHHFITGIYKRIKKTIHLKEVQQKSASPLQSSNASKRKSKQNIAINLQETFSETEIDLQKEVFLILEDIQTLLKPNSPKLTKVPFELNNPNMNQLLEMFDVSSGSRLITSEIASWILKLILP